MMNGKLLLAFLLLIKIFSTYTMQFKITMAMIEQDSAKLDNVLKRARKHQLRTITLGDYLLSDELTLEMAQIFVKHGADVQCKSKSLGRTPLFKACSRGDAELVQFFLEHGLDPNQPDAMSRTAFDEARAKRDQKIIVLLGRAALCRLVRQHRVPNVLTLLRNREIYGTFHSPH
jgi:hypothetical protein